MRILIFIAFIGLSAAASGQIKFFRMFTNNGSDIGQGIVQLEDSSYVITGSSSSFQDGPSQAYLLKIDSMGNYQWSRHYGGSEIDGGRRVLYKKDFGYFICGHTNSYGNGGFDMYLVKVKENSDPEWERTYGGSGWEQVHDAALTRDTGVMMVGETSSNETDNKDIYIVRTDKNGDTLWTKTLGGPGDDYASSIRRHNDSLFIIGGRKWIADSSMHKGYLLYLKDDGTVLWEDTMGRNGNYWINDMVVDGTRFVAVGGTSSPDKQGIDSYYYPVDLSGAPLGPYEQPNPGDEDFAYITTVGPSNDFYIATHREDEGAVFGIDMLVQKFLSNFLWSSGFGVSNMDTDMAGQIIPTSDGAAVVVGYTTGVISGGNEIFVLKIGPDDDYPDPQNDAVIEDILLVDSPEEITGFRVYPNPAHDMLHIRVEDIQSASIRLFDAAGKVVLLQEFQQSADVNVSDLPSGCYILEFSSEHLMPARTRVMVQR